MCLETRQPILTDFSYDFQAGKFYQIVAENGSGKTSFLRAITNLIPIKSGEILFDKQSYQKQKQKVFYFESNDWLDQDLTSLDYLSFVQKQWHSNERLQNELNFLGVEKYCKLPIKKYSLGMKQKLLVAMYFISDAKYFLMDEITNGLDEESRKKLYRRLDETVKEKNKCVILTSHYAKEIQAKNACRLLLKNEKIVEVKKDGISKISE